ncbi:hypothetical protein HU200_014945 [Digitaria exilis]|uniref:Uncharacterized protein n=1 Tax=Digitaria exilis TaxID=1010633 RepID=A0A835FAT7_9POAL|nr:hypothetical protein HU200_014945 [Digitaria exilis]
MGSIKEMLEKVSGGRGIDDDETNEYKQITEGNVTYCKQITEANIIFSKCKLIESNSGKTSDLSASNSSFSFTCRASTRVSSANCSAAGILD